MTGGGLLVERLRAPFGEAPGVEEISFEVAPGERLALVGASGAGKTTILRAIAGLGPGAARRIHVGGREVGSLPAEHRGVVYLHQTPLLFPHLDVAENVAFPLRVRGAGGTGVERAVREVLAALRLDGLGRRRVQTLSGGQRHRVALARAVVAQPPVLLLDEPFAALDPTLRHDVREAVRAAQAAYRPALVLVTHDLDEAGALADRVGVLLGGRLVQTAPPRELFTRPVSLQVARFLGFGNIVHGTVTEDRCFASPLGRLPLGGPPGPGIAVFPSSALTVTPAGTLAGSIIELRHTVRHTIARVAVGDVVLEAELHTSMSATPGETVRLALALESISLFPAIGGTEESGGSGATTPPTPAPP